MPELEKDIQATILDWLAAIGAFAIRCNSGAMVVEGRHKKRFIRFTNQPGCSDILACLPNGMFAAIEVKRPGNEPTEAQRAFLREVEKRGGIGLWVTSVKELERDLREAGCL